MSLNCDFCGTNVHDVEHMVTAPKGYVAICCKCIALASQVVAEARRRSADAGAIGVHHIGQPAA